MSPTLGLNMNFLNQDTHTRGPSNFDRSQIKCVHCNRTGHGVVNCFQRIEDYLPCYNRKGEPYFPATDKEKRKQIPKRKGKLNPAYNQGTPSLHEDTGQTDTYKLRPYEQSTFKEDTGNTATKKDTDKTDTYLITSIFKPLSSSAHCDSNNQKQNSFNQGTHTLGPLNKCEDTCCMDTSQQKFNGLGKLKDTGDTDTSIRSSFHEDGHQDAYRDSDDEDLDAWMNGIPRGLGDSPDSPAHENSCPIEPQHLQLQKDTGLPDTYEQKTQPSNSKQDTGHTNTSTCIPNEQGTYKEEGVIWYTCHRHLQQPCPRLCSDAVELTGFACRQHMVCPMFRGYGQCPDSFAITLEQANLILSDTVFTRPKVFPRSHLTSQTAEAHGQGSDTPSTWPCIQEIYNQDTTEEDFDDEESVRLELQQWVAELNFLKEATNNDQLDFDDEESARLELQQWVAELDFLKEATNNDQLTYLAAINELVDPPPSHIDSWTDLREFFMHEDGLQEEDIPRMQSWDLVKGETKWIKKWILDQEERLATTGQETLTYQNAIYLLDGPAARAILHLLELYPALEGSWTNLKLVVEHWYKLYKDKDYWKNRRSIEPSSDKPKSDPKTDSSSNLKNDPKNDPTSDPLNDPKSYPKSDPQSDPKNIAKARNFQLICDPNSDPQNDSKTDPEDNSQSDTQSDPESDPKSDSRIDPQSDPKSDPQSDPKNIAKAQNFQLDCDPNSDPQNDPENDPNGDPRSDSKTDPESDPKSDPKSDSRNDPQNDPKSDPENDSKTDPNGDPKSDSKTDPKANPKSDPKSDSRIDPQSDPKSDPQSDPKNIAKTQNFQLDCDPNSDPQNDPKNDPKSDTKNDSKTDPNGDPKSDSKTDPKTDPKSDPNSNPKNNPKSDLTSDPLNVPKSDPKSDPENDPKTQNFQLNCDPNNDTQSDPLSDPQSDNPNQSLQMGHEVYFWKRNYGEPKWIGPYPIINTLNDRILPTAKVLQTGDGTPQNASSEISGVDPYKFSDLPGMQQLIQSQLDKIQATQKLIRLNQLNEELGHTSALNNAPPEAAQTDTLSSANPRVPPAPDAPINETVEYLRDLSHRVYNSPLGGASAFTPKELDNWNSCAPWDRNILLTGDPPHPPPEPMPPLLTGSSGTTTNSAPIPDPKIPVPPVDLNHNPAPVKNMVLGPKRALRALHTPPLLLHRDPHHLSEYWGSDSDSNQRLRPTQLVGSASLSICCPCHPGRPLDHQGGPDSVPPHGAGDRKNSTSPHQDDFHHRTRGPHFRCPPTDPDGYSRQRRRRRNPLPELASAIQAMQHDAGMALFETEDLLQQMDLHPLQEELEKAKQETVKINTSLNNPFGIVHLIAATLPSITMFISTLLVIKFIQWIQNRRAIKASAMPMPMPPQIVYQPPANPQLQFVSPRETFHPPGLGISKQREGFKPCPFSKNPK
jgi:hypothetical protein